MRIVVDTNVLVAALRSRRGTAFEVVRRVRIGELTPVITVALFLEYEEILKRPGMVPLEIDWIDHFLNLWSARSVLQTVFYMWRPVLNDPDDDMLLEAAVAAGHCAICTFNTRHFRGSEKFGIVTLTPRELLSRLDAVN
jgi:predicted nucleic acid-binding protein